MPCALRHMKSQTMSICAEVHVWEPCCWGQHDGPGLVPLMPMIRLPINGRELCDWLVHSQLPSQTGHMSTSVTGFVVNSVTGWCTFSCPPRPVTCTRVQLFRSVA